MDRHHELTKYVTKEKIGIEIGPSYSPIAPKREGYQCLVLDIIDSETLRARAQTDPFIPKEIISNIEEVDLIGSSTEIETIVEKNGLLEKTDYILSSHNFEHLPNPIRFLQGCEKVLQPGGMLSMAIPDLRTCFDYFQPHTTLAAWLEAYFTSRERPTAMQIFEQNSLNSQYQKNGTSTITFFLEDDPSFIHPTKTLRENFDRWKNDVAKPDMQYHDVHCSAFTPASFELLIADLIFLGLIKLQLIEISATNGCEFYAHLQRPLNEGSVTAPDDFYKKRTALLHRVKSEQGANSIEAFRIRSELKYANEKISELEDAMKNIKSSKSWRATLPFRSFGAWLRRFLPLEA